jgi:muramoyltetrapeptide carboxypeptidase
MRERPNPIKPAALQHGDTVGIVAPASNIQPKLLEAGCEALRAMGYKVFYFDSIFEQDLYFAGGVERRVEELQAMFAREDVKAIVCARGGYGTNYLLERVDFGMLARHPKIFVGYSDVTTLLTAFTDASGLVTFHGPMVAKDFAHAGGVDVLSWESALGGMAEWSMQWDEGCGVQALVEGSGEGVLYGGCLSLLAASLGTAYEIQTAGTILFMEDVAAKPFQIDRMLMQLKLAGKFREVRGMVFGEMLDCRQTRDQEYTLQEVVLRIVRDLDVPVAYGVHSGHVTRGNITLPIGVTARLEVRGSEVAMKILEPATSGGIVTRKSKS